MFLHSVGLVPAQKIPGTNIGEMNAHFSSSDTFKIEEKVLQIYS